MLWFLFKLCAADGKKGIPNEMQFTSVESKAVGVKDGSVRHVSPAHRGGRARSRPASRAARAIRLSSASRAAKGSQQPWRRQTIGGRLAVAWADGAQPWSCWQATCGPRGEGEEMRKKELMCGPHIWAPCVSPRQCPINCHIDGLSPALKIWISSEWFNKLRIYMCILGV